MSKRATLIVCTFLVTAVVASAILLAMTGPGEYAQADAVCIHKFCALIIF